MFSISIHHFLFLGAVLFTIGVLGIFLNKKNVIIILMSIELILLAVNINFVSFSSFSGDISGQGVVAWSTGFLIEGNTNVLYFSDDGIGNMTTYYLTGSTKTTVDPEAGTINYATGEIIINAINIISVSLADGTVLFTMKPASNDLVPVRNQVFQIDTTNMSVSASVDTIAAGTSNAGTAYSTTSSY